MVWFYPKNFQHLVMELSTEKWGKDLWLQGPESRHLQGALNGGCVCCDLLQNLEEPFVLGKLIGVGGAGCLQKETAN